MTHPVVRFCDALPQCVQAAACFIRIEEFCQKDALLQTPPTPPEVRQESVMLKTLGTPTAPPMEPIIRLEDADISWSPEALKPALRGLSLTIRREFTAIIGPVASGKSTLLSTIFGETILNRGSIVSPFQKMAYCSQTPWILDDTIQSNIVGGTEYDEAWYQFSLSSCGLEDDIRRMPRGDQTRAGSDGSCLSGGQRQRVVSGFANYTFRHLLQLLETLI